MEALRAYETDLEYGVSMLERAAAIHRKRNAYARGRAEVAALEASSTPAA
jgi:hypothetical protein